MLQAQELQLSPVTARTAQFIRAQVGSITRSAHFRNCPVLQSFLVCITEKAVEGKESEINEYLIAREVFSRADFDPASDTIVRTQAYRLRLKLQEYYRAEGEQDEIIIEVPKGHYVPVFRRAGAGEAGEFPEAGEERETDELWPGERKLRKWRPGLREVAMMATAGVLLAAGWVAGSKHAQTAAVARAGSVPSVSPLESFWTNFLAGDREPILAYTNAEFLRDEQGDLLAFSGSPAGERGALVDGRTALRGATNSKLAAGSGSLYFDDDFTGVGEVTGAVAITNVLSSLHARVIVKRSGLITPYDLRNHNVIFLGSPFVNLILTEMPPPPSFHFVREQERRAWSGRIRNTHPQASEPDEYQVERDPATGVLRTDYAAVSLLPGIAPGHRILLLAGLTTSGTEAAAETLASPRGIEELRQKIGLAKTGAKSWPESFETVWKVELSRGLDVIQARLVASRSL